MFYYKLGQTLLQIGASQFLQNWASVITNWSIYYKNKLAQLLQIRAWQAPFLNKSKKCIVMNAFFKLQFSYSLLLWICNRFANSSKINRLSKLKHAYKQVFICSKLTIKDALKKCEICSKITIKTPEWRHWCRSGVFIINFEHISYLFLAFLLLNLMYQGRCIQAQMCWGETRVYTGYDHHALIFEKWQRLPTPIISSHLWPCGMSLFRVLLVTLSCFLAKI